MRPIKMLNKRFGKATVIAEEAAKGKRRSFTCLCDCGNTFSALGENLRKGHTNSCGCYMRQRAGEANLKHGATTTNATPFLKEVYQTWEAIKARCNCPTNHDYPRYGGRGIKVAPRWLDFNCFLEDMGYKPTQDATIERVDNNGSYSPENCKWVDRKTQANNKRSNINLTYRGKTKTLAQWAESLELNYGFLKYRIDAGWEVARAFETPSRKTAEENNYEAHASL